MKNKRVLIFTLLFFVINNTQYFWEGLVGAWSMLTTLSLILSFLILLIAFFYQLVVSIIHKFRSRERSALVLVLLAVLAITIYRPFGLINFDKLAGKDVFVAQREGTASCMTTLKLKENGKFVQKIGCFGIKKTNGTYSIKNDTIWFSNVSRGDEFYKYGRIVRDEKGNEEILLSHLKESPKPMILFIRQNSLFINAGSKEQKVVFDLNKEQVKDSLPFAGKLNDSLLLKYYPDVTDSIEDLRIVGSDLLDLHPGNGIYVSLLHNTGTFDQMILCTHNSSFDLLDHFYIGKATMFDVSSHTIEYELIDQSTMKFNHLDWEYINEGGDLEIGVVESESYTIKVHEDGRIEKTATVEYE